MHECNFRLWVVATKDLVVVLNKAIWNRLAVEWCSLVAFCNYWDVANTLLTNLNFLAVLIMIT
jgi:hypothetical protein